MPFYRDDALPIGLWSVDDGWKAMLIHGPHSASALARGVYLTSVATLTPTARAKRRTVESRGSDDRRNCHAERSADWDGYPIASPSRWRVQPAACLAAQISWIFVIPGSMIALAIPQLYTP
jgi:hypothetical protein